MNAVTVLIPAYNEADRIAETVTAARALPFVQAVIVVDDGSEDETAAVAAGAGADVVRLPRNRGKARALEAGTVRANPDHLLLLLDADLGATACEAAVLIDPVRTGTADMTIATFPVIPGKGGGRGWVVRLSRGGIQKATGGRVMNAPLSGQRCLTRAAWNAALPLAAGFGVETALTIDVLRAGGRVVEIPTHMDHRVTGRDWNAQRHRLRQLRDVARALVPRLLPSLASVRGKKAL